MKLAGKEIEFTMSHYFNKPLTGRVVNSTDRKVWVKSEALKNEVCISKLNIRKIMLTK